MKENNNKRYFITFRYWDMRAEFPNLCFDGIEYEGELCNFADYFRDNFTDFILAGISNCNRI